MVQIAYQLYKVQIVYKMYDRLQFVYGESRYQYNLFQVLLQLFARKLVYTPTTKSYSEDPRRCA